MSKQSHPFWCKLASLASPLLVVAICIILLLSHTVLGQSAGPASLIATNGTFMGLRLGASKPETERAGARGLQLDPTSQFRGAVYKVAYLSAEFDGTHRRTLYFDDQFGLYRVRWEIGNLLNNDAFTGPQLFNKWRELVPPFHRVNPNAPITSLTRPSVNNLNLDTLRQCPRGPQNIRYGLSHLSDAGLEQFMTEKLGAVRGKSCPETCYAFAMMCGALPQYSVEFLIGPDQVVRFATDNMSDGRAILVVVFENKRIANVMIDRTRPRNY